MSLFAIRVIFYTPLLFFPSLFESFKMLFKMGKKISDKPCRAVTEDCTVLSTLTCCSLGYTCSVYTGSCCGPSPELYCQGLAWVKGSRVSWHGRKSLVLQYSQERLLIKRDTNFNCRCGSFLSYDSPGSFILPDHKHLGLFYDLLPD